MSAFKAIYLFTASMVILSSCGLFRSSDNKKTRPSNSEQRAKAFLEKYQWKLIQINGELPPSSSAYLAFRFDQETFQGNAGCNSIFGAVRLNGDSIQFSSIASTEMACREESLMILENTFLTLLNKGGFHFDIADQTLNLYDQNRLVLMFGLKKE